ncbi:MAG: hypothetical protein WDW36_006375 [Sanguina aurantia]
MPPADGVQSKLTYRTQQKIEAFFTGGAARITRDGLHVVCACNDEVKVVLLATGAVVRTFAGDGEPITAIAVAPDSRTAVIASRSLSVRVVDILTGSTTRTFKPHTSPIADMAIDASGGFVATASADRTIKVWDLQGGFCSHSFKGHSGVVHRVLFHPKQLLLFSGGEDSEVRVWDLVTKHCTAVFKSHMSAVTSLALSHDGWVLLSGGRDKVVTLWDLRTSAKVSTLPVYEAVEGLVVLPAGREFPGISQEDVLARVGGAAGNGGAPPAGSKQDVFWGCHGGRDRDGERQACQGGWKERRSRVHASVGWILEGRSGALAAAAASKGIKKTVFFATAGDKGLVRLWRSDSGACVHSTAPEGAVASAATEFTDLALVPGDEGSLMVTTADARLLFYQPAPPTTPGGPSLLAQSKQLIGNIDEVTDLRFIGPPAAPTHLAVATNSESVRLYRLDTLSCTSSWVGHKDIVLCIDACHTAAGLSLGVSGAKDNEVRVWDGGSGRCLGTGVGHVGAVGAVAFARRAPRFVVSAGADKLLKVWDIAPVVEGMAVAGGGEAAAAPLALRASAAVSAHEKDINAVAVAPNDAIVATASQDRTVKLWKLPALLPLKTLRGHRRGVWSVQFSPVDQAVVTGSGDKTIKLWSISDGACLRTFEGHGASVLRACFATVGTQLLSSGADGLLKLWSVSTGECVSTFDEHEDKVWAMTTAGVHESMLATGAGDSTVAIWSNVTADDAEAALAKEDELVEQEQALQNALVDGDFSTAANLAFTLKHPGRLLDAIQRATAAGARAEAAAAAAAVVEDAQQQQQQQQGTSSSARGNGISSGSAGGGGASSSSSAAAAATGRGGDSASGQGQQQRLLSGLVRAMSPADLKTALEYCREWNTRAKHCHAAHAMLRAMLQHHKPEALLDVPGVSDLLNALEVYSTRHYSRVSQLMRSSFLLDYTLGAMKVLAPTSVLQGEEEDEQTVTHFAPATHPATTQHQLPSGAAAAASSAPTDASEQQPAPAAAANGRQAGGGDDDASDDLELDSDLAAFDEDEESGGGGSEDDGASPAAGTNGHAGSSSAEGDSDDEMDAEGGGSPPAQRQQESEEEGHGVGGSEGEGDGFLSSSSSEGEEEQRPVAVVATPESSKKTPSRQAAAAAPATPLARSTGKHKAAAAAVATPVSTPGRPQHSSSTGKKGKGAVGGTGEKSNGQKSKSQQSPVAAAVTAVAAERAVSEAKKPRKKKAVSAAVSEPPAKRKTGSRLNL